MLCSLTEYRSLDQAATSFSTNSAKLLTTDSSSAVTVTGAPLAGHRAMLIPADAATALVLRTGIMDTPSMAELKALVKPGC